MAFLGASNATPQSEGNMTDEKDSSFKVTDRRKFNADGSPRDHIEEPDAPAEAIRAAEPPPTPREPENAPAESASKNAPAESASNNVVSFPGESAKKREQPEASSAPAPSTPAAGPAPTAAPEPVAAESEAAHGAAEQAFNKAAGPRPAGVPEASFLNLLNMLAVEAAMHLGMIHPQGQEPLPVDLESARHLIDMLGMLQAKTRGNLTPEEDSLLENILADLRMQFVAVSKGR
jgi:hypothetical protein